MLTPSPPVDEAPALSGRERELVSGTYRVMARAGAQQLSLRQVAKELGVSPALLVYHFESKDRLLLATMRSAILQTVERIHDRLRTIDNPEEALRALVDALFHDPQGDRDFYLVYLDLIQYALRHPSFSGLSDLLWKYVNGSYAVVIQHGVAARLFEVDDIEQAARRARAIVEGAVLQWLQDEDWQRTHARLRDESHEMLLALLKRPPGRRRRPAGASPAPVGTPSAA
jgi:AcrR family transcriptional regulator